MIKAYDALYNCSRKDSRVDSIKKSINVTGGRAFDTLFKPILSNVFIGSNGLVQDGPASSFTQDPDKGTLSINYTMFTSPDRWGLVNLGVFSKATEGIFGVYSSGAWSSEIGFNVSYSSIRTRSRYFLRKKCDSLAASGGRQRYYLDLLTRLNGLVNQRAKVEARYAEVKDSLELLWGLPTDMLQIATADITRLNTEFRRLDSLKLLIASTTPDSAIFNDTKFYKQIIDSAISVFEIKNDIFTGYYLRWWTFRGSLSNNAISLATDSLAAGEKLAYKAKNLIRISAGWNMSWISENHKRLWFARMGADLGLRNYADHPTVKKPGARFDAVKDDYVVYNQNATYLADYKDLRPNILTFEPSVYGSRFFNLLSKMFGLEGRADARIPISRPKEISSDIYPATYSLTAGPVFRLKQDDDISKGTIGVEVGLMDAPVNDNAWRFFAARLKIGVPFSALIRKK
ncbi:hypothetical protein CCY01nite_26070 [Chitinophaga cymbidii]|uniref:Uncharacterized protein n=2 Tax=Chitinophaga cymbidii TaxID=1096750 RepID=A0A512RKV7_9BACT|nr:hypothetical protein CCY01nite_26070 [Chitinophaga cymbidii]